MFTFSLFYHTLTLFSWLSGNVTSFIKFFQLQEFDQSHPSIYLYFKIKKWLQLELTLSEFNKAFAFVKS